MHEKSTHKVIDHLFRQAHGKMVGVLVSKYGMSQLDVIENGIMEAYYKALKIWPFKGIPDNPNGWLFTASSRFILDEFRKKYRKTVPLEHADTDSDGDSGWREINESIKDPELQLLLSICHPAIDKRDQLAFMLKTLSGFGLKEIANALLVNEETIKKRLSRARKKLIKENISFNNAAPEYSSERLAAVHTVLYLLFTEGFYSSHPEKWMRKELCVEAMRLCKYLCDSSLAEVDSYAVMSIMCYHSSRFDSRVDEFNQIVLLKDQDRTLWNKFLIRQGHFYLGRSSSFLTAKTTYQIEACILAIHCMAKSYVQTDWNQLERLYDHLYRLKPQALVRLNLILVKIQLRHLDEAKELFESLEIGEVKAHKSLYYVIGAELYEAMRNTYMAKLLIEKAIDSTSYKREIRFLSKKLEDLSRLN